MRAHVLLESVRSYECPVAQIALVRPVPRMTPRMHLQHVVVDELFIAISALVPLDLAVHTPQVVVQIAGALEHFRTDLDRNYSIQILSGQVVYKAVYLAYADVVCMCRHVDVQRRSCAARVRAVLALVIAFVAVRSHVRVVRALCSEAFAAMLAYVILDFRVDG